MGYLKGRTFLLFILCCVCATFSGCSDDRWFLEERIIGTWMNVEDNRFEYIERVLTFNEDGYWSGSQRYEDVYGNLEIYTDGGSYDVHGDKLYLDSYIYDDRQVYTIDIYGQRLYLIDDYGEVIYYKY